MRILFVTSEVAPYSKTGGLGDVSNGLPSALAKLGHEVRVLTPGYPSTMDESSGRREKVTELALPYVPGKVTIWAHWPEHGGQLLYIVDFPPFFMRSGSPYVDPNGVDWPDNDHRFALLARVAQEISQGRALFWRPDVVHTNDWQTALLPYLLVLEERAGVARPPTVFTIHNLAYQGLFSGDTWRRLSLPKQDYNHQGTEFHRHFSFMKAGLVYADFVSTVSPTYAYEIQTPHLGMGLEGLLSHRSGRLRGVLNGIDEEVWNPATDPYLSEHYDANDVSGKIYCKAAIQEELGLVVDPGAMLIGCVSRLVSQKGMDWVADMVPHFVAAGCQFALLGSGDRDLEGRFQHHAASFPGRVAAYVGFNEGVAHRIEAGADLFMMPSRFEPCGLNQMYSLRYGTLPLVRRTGGLADTVRDADEHGGNGFVMEGQDGHALLHAFKRAHNLYGKSDRWRELQRRGMMADFSWTKAAKEYIQLYEEAQRG